MEEYDTEYSIDQFINENIFKRQIQKIKYLFNPNKIVLDQEQYCHIINKLTGKISVLEGACKRNLIYDEFIIGTIEDKVVVKDNHFAIINNPIDKSENVNYGDREVRIGPLSFPLYPGEEVEKIDSSYILTKYDALLIKALNDFEDHKAGDEFLIKGPDKYIPSKHEGVIDKIKGIPLSDTEGIYVQNKDSGDANLVEGSEEETIYFLQPNEQFYEKEITNDELMGLGLQEQNSIDGMRILTRQAVNDSYLRDKSKAIVIELEENEIICIYDGSESRIEKGPKTTFLGPYERPKVLNLSGGKPIRQNILKVALLKLGPDFIYDRINVRTKDNAQLIIDVTYKWSFNLEDKELKKAFCIEDFVGYAAETLSSEIRSVAALHDFEDFHAKSLEYIKEKVFDGENRIFDENGLAIFDIDITSIIPSDEKIAEKLHEAIKNNMDIYCNKMVLNATLESERQEVEGKMKIVDERKKLIEKNSLNERLEVIEKAKIKADEKKIYSESEALVIKIKNDAEVEAEKKKLEVIISELNKDGAENYINLKKVTVFDDAEKLMVVPTDSKIVLPYAQELFEE
ncbi:SPFH domain-containing protein [Nanoarchaeota archaeon]